MAEVEGKMVGFVLFFYCYSTWEGRAVYMEDLYVQPAHRGMGIGTRLWKALVTEALAKGCTR